MDTALLCQVSNGREDDWKNLYEVAFPDDERMPVVEIRQLLSNGKMLLHKSVNKNNELLCFSLSFLSGSDFVLLSYIATDATKRSGGFGSKHMKQLIDVLKKQHPTFVGLFLEIESTKEAGLDAQVLKNRQRRLAFYQRLGARRWNKGYILPSLVPGGKDRPGELLWVDFGTQPVNNNVLERVITEIYTQAYNLPVTDPSVQKVLAQFAAQAPSKPAPAAAPVATPATPSDSSGGNAAQTTPPPATTREAKPPQA